MTPGMSVVVSTVCLPFIVLLTWQCILEIQKVMLVKEPSLFQHSLLARTFRVWSPMMFSQDM